MKEVRKLIETSSDDELRDLIAKLQAIADSQSKDDELKGSARKAMSLANEELSARELLRALRNKD